MQDSKHTSVKYYSIDADIAGQRIDNFLRARLKGVPKSLIYKIVRKGEVRVNKKRIKPEYKLVEGDTVRIPPVRQAEQTELPSVKLNKVAAIESAILYEDDRLIVINKPSGTAVHGGSGLNFGLIEGLRALRPNAPFLELVHRLDRETSGCMLIAKKRSALRSLHEQLRNKTIDKRYLALVAGLWPENRYKVKAPLHKNVLQSGERMVFVNDSGKPSETRFHIKQRFANATLVEASPITGRTHQIRVHCQHAGHSIAGDPKYGDSEFERYLSKFGRQRLFLHAHSIQFIHPHTHSVCKFEAPMEPNLSALLDKLISGPTLFIE